MRLAALLLLSSCASLRVGWARVDFLTPPSDVMVCSFRSEVDTDGQVETFGKCADWNDVSEGLDAMGREQRLKKGWGQPRCRAATGLPCLRAWPDGGVSSNVIILGDDEEDL